MTAHDVALARVRAANPVPGGEPLAPAEETDAILARLLATPPDAPTPVPIPKPRRARRGRIVTAGIAVAAAVTMAVAIVPAGGESASGILAKAEAALSDADAIYHFRQVKEDLDENGAVVRREHLEVWFSGDQRRSRMLSFADENGKRGAVTGELVVAPGQPMRRYLVSSDEITEFEFGDLPAQIFDPREFYSEAARAPNAKVDEVDYLGRKALRVTVASGSGGLRYTLTVDAKTYLPMLMQQSSNNVQFRQPYSVRYPTYERLETNADTEKLLEMSPHPGARTVREP